MTNQRLAQQFAPILEEVEARSGVAESFVDKDRYRIYLATLWANVVMNPNDAGIEISDLEDLHDPINSQASLVLGTDDAVTDCFRFIDSKQGERAMNDARLSKTHKELLLYFSSMILDPDGHRKWMTDIADRRK